ncbi:hypothetical protein [Harryflintia acetispora]|uniref:Uncharacterized protein n=1 Tax=Harryflintia acetispora TaxID=1849041 RepID=A0A9X8Y829_9FIRM|nr:hypothetical protein [Harryflintia acetispora]TCL43232.1 hypothetical protein EDD78_10692 [Harryflintia acetispora]
MKTLTVTGLNKHARLFADCVVSANYTQDGVQKTAPIFRKDVSGDTAVIFVCFDDLATGQIGNVELLDEGGNILARSEEVFEKPEEKALYFAFYYKYVEKEVEQLEQL